MAIDKPIGRANNSAINEIKSVPDKRGKIPKCFSEKRGVHWVSVKKSQIETSLKKLMV